MSVQNQKIKIILSYYHNNQTLITPIHKNLSYIKDKIFNIYYPISGEITILYNNKNLNKELDKPLGLLFPGQSMVKLDIIKNEKIIFKQNKNLKNSQSTIFFNNKLYEKKKLPPINIKLRSKSPNIKDSNKISCYECFKAISFIFCRNCNKFLCENCHKKNHLNHLTIDLFNDDRLCLIFYKDKLLKELRENLNIYERIDLIKEKEIDIEKWGKIFTEKIDNINEASLQIQNTVNKNFKNEQINIGNDIDDVYYFVKNKLDNVNYNNIKNPLDLFLEINKNEKEISKLFHDSILLNKKDNLKNKIKNIYSRIEDEIENIIQEIENDNEIPK